MDKILASFTPGINFIESNLKTIVFVFVFVVIVLLGYWITSHSLKKLKSEVISYYPFDRFFPKSGKWSVAYFLITVILLAALVYVIIKGGFFLAPA